MKQKSKSLIFILFWVILISGCSQITSQMSSIDVSENAVSIEISESYLEEGMLAGTSSYISATAKDAKGEYISSSKINWAVVGGAGTISSSGYFTASQPGIVTIEASIGTLKDYATIIVYKTAMVEAYNKIKNDFLYPKRISSKFGQLNGLELESSLLSEYGSIEGFVDSLQDPYSRYVLASQDTTDSILNPSSYGGIGVVIKESGGKIAVYYVIPDQPAEKAGLKAGDVIAEIDGISVNNLTVKEVAERLRGQEDTSVKVKVLRGTETLEVEIMREKIQPKSVYAEALSVNIGYLRFLDFGYDALEDFERAYNALPQNTTGLIVDLRGNGGGYLSSSLSIASLFVPEGKPIMWDKDRSGTMEATTSYSGIKIKLPAVLIVDKKTASASEIFVSALAEQCGATVVGEKTYGKGVMQTRYWLSDGAYLYLTIREFLSSTQKTINAIGITPGVSVAMSENDFLAGSDPQKSAASEELKKKQAVQAQAVTSRENISGQKISLPEGLKEIIDWPEEKNLGRI